MGDWNAALSPFRVTAWVVYPLVKGTFSGVRRSYVGVCVGIGKSGPNLCFSEGCVNTKPEEVTVKGTSGRHTDRHFTGGRQRGSTAVEFALVLPILTSLLLAIVEFGYGFLVQASLANAARYGVRTYSVNYKLADAEAQAVSLAQATLPDPGNLLASDFSATCGSGPTPTTLTLTYRYHSLTGMFDALVGDQIVLTGKGTMQCGG